MISISHKEFTKSTPFEEVDHLSAGQVLERSAQLSPQKVALIYKGERMTYEQLNEKVNSFASGLYELGLKKGDRVVINLPNSPELVIAFYGLAKLGIITTWCNPIYRGKELGFILKNSGAKGILIRDEFEGFDYRRMVEKAREESPLEHIITVGRKGSLNFNELLNQGKGKSLPQTTIDPLKDFIKIIYTSGATGIPKG
ncbi:MAG: AMP-binding protein, partial [Thermodesulfobacteriota bacterium]